MARVQKGENKLEDACPFKFCEVPGEGFGEFVGGYSRSVGGFGFLKQMSICLISVSMCVCVYVVVYALKHISEVKN